MDAEDERTLVCPFPFFVCGILREAYMGDSSYLSLAVGLALVVWLALNGNHQVAAGAAGHVMRRKTLANGIAQTPPMG